MIFEFNGLLRRAAGDQRSITVEAGTLSQAVEELVRRYPDLKRVLLDNQGNIRKAHRVVLNGELIPQVDPGTPLGDQDYLQFCTAIAGG